MDFFRFDFVRTEEFMDSLSLLVVVVFVFVFVFECWDWIWGFLNLKLVICNFGFDVYASTT